IVVFKSGELLSYRIWQTFIVTKPFDRLSVFHPNGAACRLFHLLQFGLGEVRLITVPARPKLADVFCSGVYPLLYKFGDVNPSILVFMSAVIKQIFGNQVLLEALLNNLTFEKKAPHGSPSRIRCQVSGCSVVRLVPPLVALARIKCE